jgi:hypothetical protein
MKKTLLLTLAVCLAGAANSQEKISSKVISPITTKSKAKTESTVETKKVATPVKGKFIARPEQLKAVKAKSNVEPIKD